jgi:hypothetical protein
MPFDPTKLRHPTVTILPPTPPERGDRGGPQRVHVVIEIVDCRVSGKVARNGGYRFGSFTFWLLVLLLLAAHAQSSQWQSYPEGFVTRHQGTDAQGGQWTGSSYKQDFTTYSDFYGPHGEAQHCRSYVLSGTVHTECDGAAEERLSEPPAAMLGGAAASWSG